MPRRGSSSQRLRRHSPSGSPTIRGRRHPGPTEQRAYIFGEQLRNYSMIDKKAKNSEVNMSFGGCVVIPKYKNSFSHNSVILLVIVVIALALYLTVLDNPMARTNWPWNRLFMN